MGVKSFWKLAEPSSVSLPLSEFAGSVFLVDASVWFVQLSSMASTSEEFLYFLFSRVVKLLSFNIQVVFVFDGVSSRLKTQTLRERRKRRHLSSLKVEEAAKNAIQHQLSSRPLPTSPTSATSTTSTSSSQPLPMPQADSIEFEFFGSPPLKTSRLQSFPFLHGEDIEVDHQDVLSSLLSPLSDVGGGFASPPFSPNPANMEPTVASGADVISTHFEKDYVYYKENKVDLDPDFCLKDCEFATESGETFRESIGNVNDAEQSEFLQVLSSPSPSPNPNLNLGSDQIGCSLFEPQSGEDDVQILQEPKKTEHKETSAKKQFTTSFQATDTDIEAAFPSGDNVEEIAENETSKNLSMAQKDVFSNHEPAKLRQSSLTEFFQTKPVVEEHNDKIVLQSSSLADMFSQHAVVKKFLTMLNVPTVTAPHDAEIQCASYFKTTKDPSRLHVVTEDSDAFFFGAFSVVRIDFSSESAVRYCRNRILNDLGLSSDDFILLPLLLSSDFSIGLGNCGPLFCLLSVAVLKLILRFNNDDSPLTFDHLHLLVDVMSGKKDFLSSESFVASLSTNEAWIVRNFVSRASRVVVPSGFPSCLVYDYFKNPPFDEDLRLDDLKMQLPDFDSIEDFVQSYLMGYKSQVNNLLNRLIHSPFYDANSTTTLNGEPSKKSHSRPIKKVVSVLKSLLVQ
ncbi:hypothetical protein P9112_007822 [Eukaryota sp. TZLM1-RC]